MQAREFLEKIYFCIIDYAKAFDCMDQSKLWKILIIEMRTPDHLTCLLRNLQVKKQQLKMDMEQWTGSKLVSKLQGLEPGKPADQSSKAINQTQLLPLLGTEK